MEGERLDLFPSIHTTYAEFKKRYPHGLLLRKPARGTQGSAYSDYFADRDKLGMFGRANTFALLDGKDLVYGLRLPDGEVAISRDYLLTNGSSTVETESMTVWVAMDSASETVTAEGMRWDDADWMPGSVESNVDRLTVAEQGFLGKDSAMEPVPVITAYWFAWVTFFPETELVK